MPAAIRGLYGIADADFRPDLPLAEKVAAFVEGGACAVQLRMKSWPARRAFEEARAVRAHFGGRVPLLVNDRPDVALAAGVDGVHVGEDDLPVALVRRIVGPGFIIGATVRTLEGARAALRDGADYVGFGPVYATTTKSLAVATRGLDALAQVAREAGLPVVAIGGITLERAADVARAGAAAQAVVSDVLGADRPAARARAFVEAIAGARREGIG